MRATEHILKQNIEQGPMPVHCILPFYSNEIFLSNRKYSDGSNEGSQHMFLLKNKKRKNTSLNYPQSPLVSGVQGYRTVRLRYLYIPVELLFLMKYMRPIQLRISTVKSLSFRTDHQDKQCKLRPACSLGIGLIRTYTVAIPSAHCCRSAITGQ